MKVFFFSLSEKTAFIFNKSYENCEEDFVQATACKVTLINHHNLTIMTAEVISFFGR